MAYEDILTQIGLSAEEAKVYEALLKLGPVPASDIPLETKLSRPLVYKILDGLFEKRIIDRDETKKVTRFVAAHPAKLAEMVEARKQALVSAEASLGGIMGQMVSAYNLFSGKPNVRFFEGTQGLETLYEEVLGEGKDILLFRSPQDDIPELEPIVVKQIRRQIEKEIHTRAITPVRKEDLNRIFEYDAKNLVTRSKIDRDTFGIPAQIIVFGGKAGITSFEKPMITTIIQDQAIVKMFTILFEFVWNQGVRP